MTTLTIDQRVEILEKQKENVSDSTNQRLDGLTNASLTLGVAIPDKLATEMRSLKVELRSEMKTLGDGLKGEMKSLDSRLTDKMDTMKDGLRGEIKTLGDGLKYEVNTLDKGLRSEMATLGGRMTFMQWFMVISFAFIAILITGVGVLVTIGMGIFN